jgi:transcription elongation factor GreA
VTDTADDKVVWLTQEQFDQLQLELDELSGPGRKEITRKIELARAEGDLKENGGYHAAREEQGKQEGRIRYLQEFLRTAKVGDAPTSTTVAPGTVVTVQFDDDADDTETFLLGSREIASTTELTVYSPESALGKSILGSRTGDTVTYTAPSGAEIKVTVLNFAPFAG